MKLTKPNIPKELDADVALSVVIPHINTIAEDKATFIYDFKGVSERTALGDDLSITIKNKQNAASDVRFSLKRDSLYHILPEYLFHSLDHYLGIEGDAEEFDKRYKEQEEQKNKALTYFKSFDQQIQKLKLKYQQWLNENIFSGNQFLADFITEGHNINLNNKFIKAAYSCIPWLRDFRGNDDMIKTSLGYAFSGNATITKDFKIIDTPLSEKVPSQLGKSLDDLYCGATFKNRTSVWKVFYQTKIENKQDLALLKNQIKEFGDFFESWFLPIEDELIISFGDSHAEPYLSEDKNIKGVFLNYSTQLI